MLGVTDVIRS